MPMIPYPNTVKALHQVNRHRSLERLSGPWNVTIRPRGTTGFRPTILRGLTKPEATELCGRLNAHFHVVVNRVRVPGQRWPADG